MSANELAYPLKFGLRLPPAAPPLAPEILADIARLGQGIHVAHTEVGGGGKAMPTKEQKQGQQTEQPPAQKNAKHTLREIGVELRDLAKEHPGQLAKWKLGHAAYVCFWYFLANAEHPARWQVEIYRAGELAPGHLEAWRKELATFREHLEIPATASAEPYVRSGARAQYGVTYKWDDEEGEAKE